VRSQVGIVTLMLDALFVNGRITTGCADRPKASAIGVIAGTVVGLDDEVTGLPAARTHDLQGLPVVPGLHDAHFHLSALGQHLLRCDVTPAAAPDLGALYAAVAAFAAGLPADAWVIAEGFDDGKQGGLPERQALDRAAGGRPAWVIHASHHAGVANTEALRRMGFADPRQVPDVSAGVVGRDERGAATGYLSEAAMALVTDVIRPVPFEDFVAAIAAGSAHALSMGLTSVTEPGICGTLTGNGPSDFAAFQAARDRGLLGVRATVMPEVSALHPMDGWFGLDLGVRTGLGDDQLRVGGVKMFADGALSGRTAAVHDCYADIADAGDGLLLTDPEVLARNVLEAHRHGWQVCTHAIGDRAIDLVLDCYEAAQREHPLPDPRHRIEHCGLVSDAQVARFAALGVIPVPQARFVSELGDVYLRVLGPGRDHLLYRQRAFIDAGIELPGSSDCPVVRGEPLKGMHALVNREMPDGGFLNPAERLTPDQALRAFTHGSAYAERAEGRKGTLERGKLADLVVLADDPLSVDHDAIGEIGVVATVVGGEVRFGPL